MISVIQVVTHANIVVEGIEIAAIQKGILALIGLEKTDTITQAEKLLEKIINYRIFADKNGKTNCSLQDVQGELLLVPQFTLVAETQKGTRPGFSKGMPPGLGKQLFEELIIHAKKKYSKISSGQFGADMKVTLCNDGPMSFLLQVN